MVQKACFLNHGAVEKARTRLVASLTSEQNQWYQQVQTWEAQKWYDHTAAAANIIGNKRITSESLEANCGRKKKVEMSSCGAKPPERFGGEKQAEYIENTDREASAASYTSRTVPFIRHT
jgi:hypothetical protein